MQAMEEVSKICSDILGEIVKTAVKVWFSLVLFHQYTIWHQIQNLTESHCLLVYIRIFWASLVRWVGFGSSNINNYIKLIEMRLVSA